MIACLAILFAFQEPPKSWNMFRPEYYDQFGYVKVGSFHDTVDREANNAYKFLRSREAEKAYDLVRSAIDLKLANSTILQAFTSCALSADRTSEALEAVSKLIVKFIRAGGKYQNIPKHLVIAYNYLYAARSQRNTQPSKQAESLGLLASDWQRLLNLEGPESIQSQPMQLCYAAALFEGREYDRARLISDKLLKANLSNTSIRLFHVRTLMVSSYKLPTDMPTGAKIRVGVGIDHKSITKHLSVVLVEKPKWAEAHYVAAVYFAGRDSTKHKESLNAFFRFASSQDPRREYLRARFKLN